MNSLLPKFTRYLAVTCLILAGSLVAAAPAQAYVGPGMALGALGAGFGVLMTGMSAVFYLSTLWVKRVWRRLTGQAMLKSAATEDTNTAHRDS